MPKLTEDLIGDFSVDDGRRDRMVFDTACPGLGLRVTAKGTKTFLVQWTDPATKRKQRDRLGVWPALNLKKAREAAQVKLGEVAKGINPRTERIKHHAEAERSRAEERLTFDRL